MLASTNEKKGKTKMKKVLSKVIKKYGAVFCTLAIVVAPVVSQGCFVKFYQPEEPENFKEIMKIK